MKTIPRSADWCEWYKTVFTSLNGGKIVLPDGTEIPITSWRVGEKPQPEATNNSVTFGICGMRRSQIPEVIEIDNACFSDSWGQRDYRAAMQDRQAACKVAVANDLVVGFSVWGLEKQKLYLMRLGIQPDIQRACVGSALLANGLKRLSIQRRPTAWCCVAEKNLGAQLWLKANGWIATRTQNAKMEFVFRAEWDE